MKTTLEELCETAAKLNAESLADFLDSQNRLDSLIEEYLTSFPNLD